MTAYEALNHDLDDQDFALLEARLREAVHIDAVSLQDEFVKMPGLIGYWSARHAEAIGQNLRATSKRKKLRGLIWLGHKSDLETAGKKPTKDQIDALTDSDPRYNAALEDEFDSEVERERMKGAVMALGAKKDMLVQLGANQRAEAERDPVIRDRMFAGRASR